MADDLVARIAGVEQERRACAACSAPLTEDGPSELFCGEWCQERWHHERALFTSNQGGRSSRGTTYEELVRWYAAGCEHQDIADRVDSEELLVRATDLLAACAAGYEDWFLVRRAVEQRRVIVVVGWAWQGVRRLLPLGLDPDGLAPNVVWLDHHTDVDRVWGRRAHLVLVDGPGGWTTRPDAVRIARMVLEMAPRRPLPVLISGVTVSRLRTN